MQGSLWYCHPGYIQRHLKPLEVQISEQWEASNQIILSVQFISKGNVTSNYERYLRQISAQTCQQSMWTHSTSSKCPAIGLRKLLCAHTLTASIPRCLPDAWQLASSTLPELHWSRLMRLISWKPERGLCVRMRARTNGSNHGQLSFYANEPNRHRKQDRILSIASDLRLKFVFSSLGPALQYVSDIWQPFVYTLYCTLQRKLFL